MPRGKRFDKCWTRKRAVNILRLGKRVWEQDDNGHSGNCRASGNAGRPERQRALHRKQVARTLRPVAARSSAELPPGQPVRRLLVSGDARSGIHDRARLGNLVLRVGSRQHHDRGRRGRSRFPELHCAGPADPYRPAQGHRPGFRAEPAEDARRAGARALQHAARCTACGRDLRLGGTGFDPHDARDALHPVRHAL